MTDWQAEVRLEVPFHDVDVMGVAWHGHYVKGLIYRNIFHTLEP